MCRQLPSEGQNRHVVLILDLDDSPIAKHKQLGATAAAAAAAAAAAEAVVAAAATPHPTYLPAVQHPTAEGPGENPKLDPDLSEAYGYRGSRFSMKLTFC